MSYVASRGTALGASWSDVAQAVDTVVGGVKTVKKYADKAGVLLDPLKVILNDPALPQVSSIIMEIYEVEQTRGATLAQKTKAIKTAAKKPLGYVSNPDGVGLSRFVKPLQTYLWARKHPYLAGGIALGALGLLFYTGYAFGKRKRRSRQ